uniref:Lariat debranching enzyme C-terminal domain-containing protein n=2 Tax=Clastoptera arizonana TaxID=38151 RepID=A0A1B6CUA3_9HEMI
MKIAVEGCAHGELEKIYESVKFLEIQEGIKVDLLICCGDFQSTRNKEDLRCMAVPPKYQQMCSFHKYYSGEKTAPILTIFIGGNHEASNYLQELPYGGWVAPNIYYMGYASVLNIGGVRIGGISGIYKGHDYMKGHFEKVPYNDQTKRSVYHVRNLEVFRLKQVKEPIDIMFSHDWPRGVYNYGNVGQLLKIKPFFMKEVQADELGSIPCEELLRELKPKFWFSGHLHVKFAAIVPHPEVGGQRRFTKFLALDKCLPRRKFLQILDVPSDSNKPIDLEYDLEWLSILHLTNHLLSVKRGYIYMPDQSSHERSDFTPTIEEKNLVLNRFENNLKVPSNFIRTAPVYDAKVTGNGQPSAYINYQTKTFCEKLGIDDPVQLLLEQHNSSSSAISLSSFLSPDKSVDLSSQCSSQTDIITSRSYDDSFTLSRTVDINKSCSSSQRSSLCLPPPKEEISNNTQLMDMANSSEEPVVIEKTSLIVLPIQKNEDEKMQINEESPEILKPEGIVNGKKHIEEDTEDNPKPMFKKFKRRNQAIYSNIEDD